MRKLLVFTSPTCGPCRVLKPALAKIQAAHGFEMEIIELSPVTRVEFDARSVRGAPTVICLNDDGSEVGRFVGSMAPNDLEAQLQVWNVIRA